MLTDDEALEVEQRHIDFAAKAYERVADCVIPFNFPERVRKGEPSELAIMAARFEQSIRTTDAARIAALEDEAAELRSERDALLQEPLDFAQMDSIDDDNGTPEMMLAYYWYRQAQEARATLKDQTNDQ